MVTSNYRFPRGIRNNNPLNIKRGSPWKGLHSLQSDCVFCTFSSLEYGYRAAAICLRTYVLRHGCRTLREIIHRWSSTDRSAYLRYVSSQCLIDEDCDVSAFFTSIRSDAKSMNCNFFALKNILFYMACFENGSYMLSPSVKREHDSAIFAGLRLV